MTDIELWQLEIERWRRSIRDLGEDVRRKRALIDRRVADAAGEEEIASIAVRVARFEAFILSVQLQIDTWAADETSRVREGRASGAY